jgi:hypothetical protein
MQKIILFGILCLLSCVATAQVQYAIKLDPDGVTFNVCMKSSTAYTLPLAQISTAQVTVIVPTGTAANQFAVTNLTSYQNQMTWSQNARVNAPTENPTKDYISFGFQGSSQFAIAANTDIKLFSFRNSGTCLGEMQLIVNATDAFNQLPNSQSTNPGNSITILAKKGDSYLSNYGTGANACTNATPIANNDTANAPLGTTTNIAILTNDSNGDGTSPAVLTKVTTPIITTSATKGMADVRPDGSINYTPNVGATGTDTLAYRICNFSDNTKCSIATITINIGACPSPNCGTATIVKN